VTANVILFRRRREAKVNNALIAVIFAMFCVATINLGSDIHRLLAAFINPQLPADLYLQTIYDPAYIVEAAASAIQILIGDGFLLYRLYLVWGKNRFIILPLVLSYIGCAIAGFGGLHILITSTGETPVFIALLRRWILAFCILTLITNTTCTCLIAGRILWAYRKTSFLGRVGGRSLVTPAVLIVESGAIYPIALATQLGLYISGSFAYLVVYNSMPTIIAIAFSLLIVRLGLGLSASGTDRSQKSMARGQTLTSSLLNIPPERAGPPPATPGCQCGHGIALRSLEVRVHPDSLHGPNGPNFYTRKGMGGSSTPDAVSSRLSSDD